ncbi:MAG TPA: gluconeogenesis factor YvcK family protein [Terriglobia bacterium]|nr:gluconeogenesis factor YvcK family protein [Terriglobia bacterium]
MKVLAIGGGTGLATLLRGLKAHVRQSGHAAPRSPAISRLTAVVTVTDEGGSSGRLRREFRILPPGDIRNCMVALAEDETLFTRLFNYRFSSGRGLRGHSFGNLFLTALTHLTRDFAQAVKVSSEVLAICGEIFPATLADVRLRAKLRDGRTIAGERAITRTRAPIERLEIVPSGCRPLPETLAAIEEADLITLGPGSLYTSLIPNLLVRGIPEAIARSRALKIYVCNLMTQPGETRRCTASDHVRAIQQHSGRRVFDYVVLNTRSFSPTLRRRYAKQRAEPVVNDLDEIRALGVEPITASLLDEDRVARHDPRRLAQLLLDFAAKGQNRRPRETRRKGGS